MLSFLFEVMYVNLQVRKKRNYELVTYNFLSLFLLSLLLKNAHLLRTLLCYVMLHQFIYLFLSSMGPT